MRFRVKLFAALRSYAPEGQAAGQPFEVELPEASTVGDLLQKLGIRPREAKVTFVNAVARGETYRLQEGDEVGIFPAVGGG